MADLETVPFMYSNNFADPDRPSLVPENLTISLNPHTWAKVRPNTIPAALRACVHNMWSLLCMQHTLDICVQISAACSLALHAITTTA